MKNNKYYAFITFGHNGVTIKAGDIFDANEVKFSKVDIDFLRSQQKIISGLEYVISHPELADEFGLESPVVEPVEIPAEITPRILVNAVEVQPGSCYVELVEKAVEQELEEVVAEEVVEETVDAVEPIIEEVATEEVVLESDDEIEVIINESSLNRMKKADLVKLAIKFDIDSPDKLTKTELVKKIAEINS